MADGQYKFSIGLDDKQLEMDIAQAKKAFDSLVKQAQQAGAKIDKMPNPFENIGQNASQVAQATQQFNGLNMATQQLVRELPAASMGINTFFLAISNNLPIFADQVKNLRQQGTSVAGVLKGIGTALFSWQTALVLGVTAVAMYGKEIGKWVVSLFKGKEALDAMADAEKTLRDVRRQGIVDAQEEITKIRLTVQAAQNATASIEERTNALRALKSEYPDYFANLSDEQIMYGDVADSVQALIDKTIALAQARKAFNQLVENEENMRLLEGTEGYAKLQNEISRHEGSGHKKYLKQEVIYNPSGIRVGSKDTESDETGYKKTESYKRVLDAQEEFLDNLEEMGEKGDKEAKALFEKISDEYDGNVQAYIESVKASNEKLNSEAEMLVTSKDGENKSAIEAAEREAERQKKEAERIKKERERSAKESAELSQKLQNEADQAEIEAMAEGTDKVIAQIKFNYAKRKQTIDKVAAELKAKQGGALTEEQQGWVNEAYKGNKMQATDEWEKYVDEQIELAGEAVRARIEAQKAEESAWNDYLIKFGTFQEKVKATTEKYANAINNAKNEAERKTLEAERDMLLAEFNVEASEWAKKLVDESTARINVMLRELRTQVEAKEVAFSALDSSDSQTAEQYRNEINELNAKIKTLQAELGKASRSVDKSNWAEATQVFQNIGSAATDAADGIAEFDEGLANALRGIAQLASSATNIIGAIQGVITAFKEGMSGIEKASAILAVIGAAIQLVSGIAEVFSGGEEAAKAATLAALEYARALEKISNIELRESFSNYFGADDFGRFTALLGKAREQLQEIDAIAKELDRNWVGGTGVDYSASLESYSWNRQAQAALIKKANEADIQLVADMRSGWQKFWGTGYQNVDVKDLKDFFDEDGILNVDMLKAYYDNYAEYLDAGQKELIESLINTGEEYAANLAEINSYMQDIFGDLGASITDSLVDAFRNGTDAAIAMGDAVSGVIEQIATDLAHSAFIQPLLDEANKAIEALNERKGREGLTDEEYMSELIGITSNLMDKSLAQGEDLKLYLENLQRIAEEKGIDIFNSDSSRSSSRSGIAQASQDSIDELNGRMTAIQSHTYSIMEYQRQLTRDTAAALRHLSGIEINTHELYGIRGEMAKMRKDISDIATRGVTIR